MKWLRAKGLALRAISDNLKAAGVCRSATWWEEGAASRHLEGRIISGRARLVAIAAAVALVCLPAAARADVDGNELWRLCTGKGARDNGLC